MVKKALNILLFCIIMPPTFCQTGGSNVYEFLNLTNSSLVAALGGSNVSLPAADLNLASHNPALLNDTMNNNFALSYVNYFAGINYGMAMYSRSLNGSGNFAAGITYLNYGSFTESDVNGEITGSFRASEYAFAFVYSRSIDSLFSVGINFKPVLSYLEKYSSYGFAFDIAAGYHNRSNRFSAGLVIRNAGYQLTTYAGEPHQKLPFEIQAGLSQRLAYAPFRFSLTLRHLEKFDLTHEYISGTTAGETTSGKSGFLENAMRHAIFGAEIIPHKNFYICGGYNYQRRQELKTESKVAGSGLSWGFGINTSMIDIGLGRATYHLAGSSTNISVSLKLDNIFRRIRN
jgi:hypothetical protein